MRHILMINEKQVRRYCADDITKIENYDKAIYSSEMWHCHHRREIEDGIIMGVNDLKQKGLYYKRPASELVFMTLSEHRILHNKNRSEETRRKIGVSHKGKPGNRLGVKLSEETRRKMSEARKGRHHSEESRRKISESNTGRHHSQETRKRQSEATKAYWERKRSEQTTSA